jgi:hypothetical protein
MGIKVKAKYVLITGIVVACAGLFLVGVIIQVIFNGGIS